MRVQFETHRLSEDGLGKAAQIAEAFDRLADEVGPLCHDGYARKMMLDHLEIACFYAKKSMASGNVEEE